MNREAPPAWLWISIGAVVFSCSAAQGGLNGFEHSWTATSPDGCYLLVMVSPKPVGDFGPEVQDLERGIRSRYLASGVYLSEGSSDPLWTIPYHANIYEVYFSPDGNHVVISREIWRHTMSEIRPGGYIHFHHKSSQPVYVEDHEFISGFTLKWMVNALLGDSSGRSFLPECEATRFDADALTYTIATSHGDEYTFDITTGEVVGHKSPWYWYLGVPLILVPLSVCGIYRVRSARQLRDPSTRGHRLQVSLRTFFVLFAAMSLFLALVATNWVLAAIVGTIAVVGAGIACVCSRSRQAWLFGAVLSLYGAFLGMAAWAALHDSYHQPYSTAPGIAWLVVLVATGVLVGGLVAGWLDTSLALSRRRHVPNS